jgi:sigma-E factor negative regulatory protein RseC
MTETAIVRSLDGDVIKLACGHNEGCSSCSSSFCSADTHLFEAANPKGFALKTGDTVDIYLPPGKTVMAGFLVLILPLLLFAAAYLIAGRVIDDATEGTQAVFGLLGLAGGFLFSFTFSRKRKASSLPVIVSVREKGYMPPEHTGLRSEV